MQNETVLQKTITDLLAEIETKNYQLRRMKQLATKDGFVRAYYELCATCKTNLEAYETLAEEYEEIFEERGPYSDYESFRKVLSRKYKRT